MVIDEKIYKKINYYGAEVFVSKNGEVIFNDTKRNAYYNHDGYLMCSIKIPNKGWKSVFVHRLVAMAYLPNPNNLPEVNHIDYDRKNACVNNLEWISKIDNIRYSKCNRPNYNGEKNPNYGNRKLSQKYKESKEYAKLKQGRPKTQNGRCQKISLYKDDVYIKTFDYIGECCEYLINTDMKDISENAIRCGILRSIKYNRKYKKHYTFTKE